MTIATLLFGFLVSVMFGAGFHLWKDGGPGRLIFYEVLSGFGFWSGHSLSSYVVRWDFWKLGELHLGFAILGTVIFLGFGYWLSAFKHSDNNSPQ